MSRQSLSEFIGELRRHGRDVAFIQRSGYRTERWTYQAVFNVASQFARELELRGIAPGERILLWGRNSAEWVSAFFGSILRGVVVVPIDLGAGQDFASRVAEQVDAKLVVVSAENTPPGGARPFIPLESLREHVARNSSAVYTLSGLDRKSIAQIIFTSGSTANPKGVVITHGNLLANIEPLETGVKPYLKWERIVHPIHFLDLVPMSHVFGQFMGVWVPPLLRGTVVFQDTLNPSEIISTVNRERISVMIAVPRVLEALQNKIERDLESDGLLNSFRKEFAAAAGDSLVRRLWRFRSIHQRFGWKFWAMISGGATLEPDAELFWTRIGYAAIQGYGMTETTSLVSVNHPFRVGSGSIGKVLKGRDVKLDASGEILVRGENIATGYWQGSSIQPMSSSAPTEEGDGWFHTGDLGALDSAGNLYFKGRKKNVIVTSAGMKIFPADLEALLRRDLEVKDCVILGFEIGGNAEPCAVLLLRNSQIDCSEADLRSQAEKLIARVNESLAEYQRIRRWFVWPEADFPRTATGKPRLQEIRAVLEAQTRGAPMPGLSTAGGITELVQGLRTQQSAVDQNSHLETELNLSSLDRVELLGALEDRYQIDLNETQFTSAKTVGELESLVRDASSLPAARGESKHRNSPRLEFAFPRWAQRWPITWIRTAAYYLLTLPATHLMAHPRVSGRENLRGVKGPVLVVSNHVIFLDVGFVLAALPARLRRRLAVAMGGERMAQMRRPPKEWFFLRRWFHQMNYFLVVSLFNVFPLPKTSGFRESFHFAGELVDRGWSILVFPEGELTPDGKLQPFRAGVGLLAKNLNIPIVPMRIDGAYEVRKATRLFNRPGCIQVHIGKPRTFAHEPDPLVVAKNLEEMVRKIESPSAESRDEA